MKEEIKYILGDTGYLAGSTYSILGVNERIVDGDNVDIVVFNTIARVC